MWHTCSKQTEVHWAMVIKNTVFDSPIRTRTANERKSVCKIRYLTIFPETEEFALRDPIFINGVESDRIIWL